MHMSKWFYRQGDHDDTEDSPDQPTGEDLSNLEQKEQIASHEASW